MISEFALDPELVAGWCDSKEWALFREAFGPNTGRLGSSFPSATHRKWQQAVIKAFYRTHPTEDKDSGQRRKLDEVILHFSQLLVLREVGSQGQGTWVDKILEEHSARPFHGILSEKPQLAIPEWITPKAIYEGNQPQCWAPPSNQTPERTPEALAKSVEPLLLRSRDVTFVDPWFKFAVENKPNRRSHHLQSLEAMLSVFWGEKRCVVPREARLVLLAPKADRGIRDPDTRSSNAEKKLRELVTDCQACLPCCIPVGREMSVTIVRERRESERFHNRYILTELTGVAFGTGLDAGWPGETDDVFRLSREQFEKRSGQYGAGISSYFDIVHGPQQIKSSR